MPERIEDTIKLLVEEGRKKGYLTYGEMNKLLEESGLAERASQRSSRRWLTHPSAICERHEFPVQRKRMCVVCLPTCARGLR